MELLIVMQWIDLYLRMLVITYQKAGKLLIQFMTDWRGLKQN